MQNIVITGVGGFVGRYVVRELKKACGSDTALYGISNVPIAEEVSAELCGSALIDICDKDALRRYLTDVKPNSIYHLAAQSSAALSLKDPEETIRNNITGALNLLEIIRQDLRNTHILIVGSADVYGEISGNHPIDEFAPLNPMNPYAVSKAAVDYIAAVYWRSFRVKTIRTRSFNHTGPGQSEVFVLPSFARQIALIEAGKQKPEIFVGDISVRRDFTDVRDAVRAYRLLMEKGEPGEVYNVCSGETHTIKELLDYLLQQSHCSIAVRQDVTRLRPADIPVLVGDNRKLQAAAGWQPEITIHKTLDDVLDFWRKKVNYV